MADTLWLNRAAVPATGELQLNTPVDVVLRIRNNLRPLFPVGKPNPPPFPDQVSAFRSHPFVDFVAFCKIPTLSLLLFVSLSGSGFQV
jgi:hypothetical protein